MTAKHLNEFLKEFGIKENNFKVIDNGKIEIFVSPNFSLQEELQRELVERVPFISEVVIVREGLMGE